MLQIFLLSIGLRPWLKCAVMLYELWFVCLCTFCEVGIILFDGEHFSAARCCIPHLVGIAMSSQWRAISIAGSSSRAPMICIDCATACWETERCYR